MRTLMIACIRAYQVVLSPLFRGCCRFEPSCSNYAIEAIRVHGALKGFLLGAHGYDRVPPKGRWRNDCEKWQMECEKT